MARYLDRNCPQVSSLRASASLPRKTVPITEQWRCHLTLHETAATVVHRPPARQPALSRREETGQRQLGSQICMCQVDCEIGRPVRIGYIHAKLVITAAT